MYRSLSRAVSRYDVLSEHLCGCRIQRDVAMRGRDIAGVIEQYTKFVKPAFDTFVAPSRKHADVIIPWGRFVALAHDKQIVIHCVGGMHHIIDAISMCS